MVCVWPCHHSILKRSMSYLVSHILLSVYFLIWTYCCFIGKPSDEASLQMKLLMTEISLIIRIMYIFILKIEIDQGILYLAQFVNSWSLGKVTIWEFVMQWCNAVYCGYWNTVLEKKVSVNQDYWSRVEDMRTVCMFWIDLIDGWWLR